MIAGIRAGSRGQHREHPLKDIKATKARGPKVSEDVPPEIWRVH
jgi:hypothetical protein